VKVGDLVKVYNGTQAARHRAIGLDYRIGIVTGDSRGYYMPVQIGNTWDLFNIERLEVINASR
jgi:hypothetical protein